MIRLTVGRRDGARMREEEGRFFPHPGVRDYRRKKKQPRKRRAETDEEFIEEMFSEVGMKRDHDGFHVV